MLAYLARVTGVSVPRGVWRGVRATCVEMTRLPAKSYVRGKFEAWWFIEFSKRVAEGLQKVATEAGGSVSFSAQLSQSTFIQLLSSGIAPSNALDTFLKFHLRDRSATLAVPQAEASAKGLVQRLREAFK